jgi:glycosyltransferase involved in cell wall biosynthesis
VRSVSNLGTRGKIILLHFAGRMPLAGIAWQAMHHLMGLRRLGWDAWYVEDSGANPYDPRADSVAMACDYNLAFLRQAMARYGFGERWVYWDAINDVHHGLSRDRVRALYAEADCLINLCGATRLRDEHFACPVRIMIDTDPVYEQIKYARSDPAARAYLDAHTHFFSYGENLGGADCPVPLAGVDWRPTRPPVDPGAWPRPEGAPPCFGTIGTWENKGKDIDFGGVRYVWSKHVNFLRFLGLPRRRPGTCFEIAVQPPDENVREAVEAGGWHIVDPRPISYDMRHYAAFIAGARGEFTVAKDIYVRPNSGWFSDRSVCYLAAGRPVVTMRTGFAKFYPVGEGLFDYTTEDEALAAIDAIAADYGRHSRAARAIASEYFAADRVLGALLAAAGL